MFLLRKKASSLGRVTAITTDYEYTYVAITPGLRDSRFLSLKKALTHALLHRRVIVLPHCAACLAELDRFSWRGRWD